MTARTNESSARAVAPLVLRRKAVQLIAIASLLAATGTTVPAADTETRAIEPGAFDTIETDIPADIRVHIGKPPMVRITAEPAVLMQLKVSVTGTTLTLSAKGSFQTREPVSVTIQATELRALTIGGAASVELDALQADRLEVRAKDSASATLDRLDIRQLGIDIGGSATVHASGTVTRQRVVVTGSGSFAGEQLQISDADVKVSDAGEVRVDVHRRLTVVVSDAGSVVYTGSPEIRQQISGAGAIDRL